MIDKWICLDCETTGVNPDSDEIISLSIVNQDGEILFNELFKPLEHTYFPSATKIHGLGYHDLKTKNYFREYKLKVMQILSEYNYVVGYNIAFDMQFLNTALGFSTGKHLIDVMKMYSDYKKVPDRYNRGYKWFKLSYCAEDLGYVPTGEYHNSLEDVMATIFAYNTLKDQDYLNRIERMKMIKKNFNMVGAGFGENIDDRIKNLKAVQEYIDGSIDEESLIDALDQLIKEI